MGGYDWVGWMDGWMDGLVFLFISRILFEYMSTVSGMELTNALSVLPFFFIDALGPLASSSAFLLHQM